MTSKAYIVANEQQEREVLRKLEKKGNEWNDKRNATDFIPSEKSYVKFPYAIMSDRFIGWLSIDDAIVENYEIVYDGRKEKQMSDKYVVSQGFMNELNLWCDVRKLHDFRLLISDLHSLPDLIKNWQKDELQSDEESNNRLIAIIRWVNGEDVFEVEKPKKWIVRSKEVGNNNRHSYVRLVISSAELTNASVEFDYDWATYFDTREEAESWANAHQEVVQAEVD